MKKSTLLLFVFFVSLFAINFVNSEPVLILQKTSFQPGETLIGEIKIESGNFSAKLTESNFVFYEGRRETYVEYNFFQYNNSYYFYAYLTKSGNLTINIKNILYRDIEGNLKTSNINKTLEIKERPITIGNKTYTQILSIRPGVIFTSKNPELIFENKGNKSFNITYGLKGSKESFKLELFPQRPEKAQFNVSNKISEISIASYENFFVPVIYNGFNNPEEENTTNLKADHLIFQIKSKEKQTAKELLTLFNFANNTISNLQIKKSSDLITIGTYNNTIPGGGNLKVNLSFLSNYQGSFSDNLTITFKENKLDGVIIIPIEVYVFSENTSLENISLSIDSSTPTCLSLGGKFCITGQEYCDGDFTISLEGNCCIGTCAAIQGDSSSGPSIKWIIGLIIVLALGGGGYYLYKKTNLLKPKSPEKMISEKSDTYEKRVTGNLTRS